MTGEVLPVRFTRRVDGGLERAWNDRALVRRTVDGFADVEFARTVA